MSLPTQSRADIEKRILAYFRTAFPGFPLDTKKFLGRTARASANTIWGFQGALEQVEVDIVPSAQTSDDVLSAWAVLLGLPDGAGGFGRAVPSAASGGVATLTGVKGTVYPLNAIATAEDGTTQILLTSSVTIPGGPPGLGSITGNFDALTTGTVGNLPVGSILTWQSPPAGADPTFTLTSPLGGGVDLESNSSVFSRIVSRLQNPPRGGVSEDYHIWAQEAAGVVGVYVYPKRSGTGTVDVVITTGGSGQGRIPSITIVANAQAIIDSLRPAGAEAVTVYAPSMPNANGHVIKVRVVPENINNKFDWDDTSGPFSVNTYTPGAPAKLKLNTIAPDSLKNAINNFIASTGLKPRLQVISTGSVINVPVGCVAFVDSGGKTELTLETLPPAWVPPTPTDAVYAFGPAVTPIATGILFLIDSLGPSKVSGYADTFITWDSKLTISAIIGVAQDALGSDGSVLISEVPVGGATIDNVVADIEGTDTSIPELLYAKHIIVTQ